MLKRNLIIIGIVIIIAIAGLVYYWYRVRVPKPEEITDPTIKQIMVRGKIVVGTEPSYPPMEDLDEQGNTIGFDADLAKEIAADLGVSVEFYKDDFDKLFDDLQEGKADILLSALTITAERMKAMAFSDPYFNAGQVILIRKDQSDVIKEPEDLSGKKVGSQEHTTSLEQAEKYSDNVVSYVGNKEAKDDVLARKIDALILDYPVASNFAKADENLIIAGEPFTTEFYGVAVRKEDKALLERINNTITHLTRIGRLKEIGKKWFK